jgi:2-polyprenyl-3-methyl-5-hydroxy-6-metoxy-1,4-benzoquinol methylase
MADSVEAPNLDTFARQLELQSSLINQYESDPFTAQTPRMFWESFPANLQQVTDDDGRMAINREELDTIINRLESTEPISAADAAFLISTAEVWVDLECKRYQGDHLQHIVELLSRAINSIPLDSDFAPLVSAFLFDIGLNLPGLRIGAKIAQARQEDYRSTELQERYQTLLLAGLYPKAGLAFAIRYLAEGELNNYVMMSWLQMIVPKVGYPAFMRELRHTLAFYKERGQSDQFAKLENIGKKLLDIPQHATLYLNLVDLYNNIDFSKYPVTERTIDDRIQWLSNSLPEWITDKDPSKIDLCDVGSGDGKQVVGLLQNGFIHAKGVDIVQKHVDEANLDANRAGYGSPFEQATWTDLPYDDGSLDVITCLGRSLTHAEDAGNLYAIFTHFRSKLRQGGKLVIDFPDTTSEGYSKELKKSRRNLATRFALPPSYAENYWYIVDSPDVMSVDDIADGRDTRINFYNRFTPSFEVIRDLLVAAGFADVKIARRSPVSDNLNNFQIEIVATAMEDPLVEYPDPEQEIMHRLLADSQINYSSDNNQGGFVRVYDSEDPGVKY